MIDRATEKFIPYCRHSVDDDEIAEVVDTLKSDWLTAGPKVQQFEQEFSEYIGSKCAVAVSSCTAALHLALAGYDIRDGDEVVTTPLTFAATADVVEYQRAEPVFVDIDKDTFNLDPNQIEEKITSRTKAIIPVHYGGIPCDLTHINEIAERHDLYVIEDAAHAVGSEYKGQKIGAHGNPTAFSFYPTKNITTVEGGMLTTNDESFAERIKILSLHGISKDAWKRHSKQGQWYYEIHQLGYKYNFTDLQASLGLQQIRKLDTFNARREKLASYYFEALKDVDGIRMPAWYHGHFSGEIDSAKNCWHLFVIMVESDKLSINRDQFVEKLKTRNIGSSVHFIPLHFQPYYAKKYGYQKGDFPNTEEVFGQIISLPLYPTLRVEEVKYIVEVIKNLSRSYRK